VTTQLNKVHRVTTISRVAEQLGEDPDWLSDVANEMEVEDGVIWVYDVGNDVRIRRRPPFRDVARVRRVPADVRVSEGTWWQSRSLRVADEVSGKDRRRPWRVSSKWRARGAGGS